MATFKAEVYAHQKKQDGTYNIKIRVTHNKKKRYLATPWFVSSEDLTRKLKLKNQKYIDYCDALIKRYRSICDNIGECLVKMDVDDIVKKIQQGRESEVFDLDIVAYGYRFVEELRSTGHRGNASTYVCALRSLVKFVGRERISIFEITVKLLNDWASWIGEQTRVVNGFSQHNYLNRLRSIHNRAKREFNDEDAGIIHIPNSPFSHIEMPKVPVVRKRSLSVEQIRQLASLPYHNVIQPGNNRHNFARDVFLLSFCLVGMNPVDLYYCDNCKNGRITYQRIKTKNRRQDKAEISIKIEPELKPLFDKYRDTSGERIFSFYHSYSSVDSFNVAVNKGLKQIQKEIGTEDLELYAARHSWATIAVNEAGVDKYTVHQALNHVDDSMRVTDIYIKKSWDHIDEANRKVLDLLQLEMPQVNEHFAVAKKDK